MGPSTTVVDMMQGAAEWLRLILALLGAIAILVGAAACVTGIINARAHRRNADSASARLTLARYLALALEFQLAADVIETSVTADWTKVARLAAIAAIRTALNYFLSRDMNEDRRLVKERAATGQASGEMHSR
jgi:uncharacterized membrane protein